MSSKKAYKLLIGSRAQVMHGTAKKTGGGLRKKDLKYNKYGKIVSKRASKSAKKCNNLVNAGYVTQKGSFGVIKKNQKGGDPATILIGLGVGGLAYSLYRSQKLTRDAKSVLRTFNYGMNFGDKNDILISSFIGTKESSSQFRRFVGWKDQFRYFELFHRNQKLFLRWCDLKERLSNISKKNFTCLNLESATYESKRNQLDPKNSDGLKELYEGKKIVSIELTNVSYNGRILNGILNGETSDEQCEGKKSFGKNSKGRNDLIISKILKGKNYDPFDILNFNGKPVSLYKKFNFLNSNYIKLFKKFIEFTRKNNMICEDINKSIIDLIKILMGISTRIENEDMTNNSKKIKRDSDNYVLLLHKYIEIINFLQNSCIDLDNYYDTLIGEEILPKIKKFEQKFLSETSQNNEMDVDEENLKKKITNILTKQILKKNFQMERDREKIIYVYALQFYIGKKLKYNDYVNLLDNYVNFYKFVLFKDRGSKSFKLRLFIIFNKLYYNNNNPCFLNEFLDNYEFNKLKEEFEIAINNLKNETNPIHEKNLKPFFHNNKDESALCYYCDLQSFNLQNSDLQSFNLQNSDLQIFNFEEFASELNKIKFQKKMMNLTMFLILT